MKSLQKISCAVAVLIVLTRVAFGADSWWIASERDAAWTNKPAHTGDPEQTTAARNFRLHGSLVYLF